MSAEAGERTFVPSVIGKEWVERFRPLIAAAIAIVLSLAVCAVLIAIAGFNPLVAFAAIWDGAFGSTRRISSGFAKFTPYLLCGIGIALCFRARVINIGGEGQIALGGLAATWMALTFPSGNMVLAIGSAFVAGTVAGALWSLLAAAMHLTRGVHEVLVTLLLNFVALLLVTSALTGSLGEVGAGFPQSPLLPQTYWLPKMMPRTEFHIGIIFAIIVAIVAHVFLWKTTLGMSIRMVGASRSAAQYAGYSAARVIFMVMGIAGASAGLAGAIQVLGIHYRLIDGYSLGFGFISIAIALLGMLNPLALIPAALFFSFLEVGALSMQRQIGVPSSLVEVMQGLTMLFMLAAMAVGTRRGRV